MSGMFRLHIAARLQILTSLAIKRQTLACTSDIHLGDDSYPGGQTEFPKGSIQKATSMKSQLPTLGFTQQQQQSQGYRARLLLLNAPYMCKQENQPGLRACICTLKAGSPTCDCLRQSILKALKIFVDQETLWRHYRVAAEQLRLLNIPSFFFLHVILSSLA